MLHIIKQEHFLPNLRRYRQYVWYLIYLEMLANLLNGSVALLLHLGHYMRHYIVLKQRIVKKNQNFHFSEFGLSSNLRKTGCSIDKYSAL